jgi:threonine/homoserine/homoserine lactone efflux protein
MQQLSERICCVLASLFQLNVQFVEPQMGYSLLDIVAAILVTFVIAFFLGALWADEQAEERKRKWRKYLEEMGRVE